MQNNITIPPVFNQVQPADLVEIYDYELSLSDGAFGYVRQAFIGRPADETGAVIMRPIISVMDILDMLQSATCVCLVYKPRGRSHCMDCYKALPPDKQKALYRRFRNGYEAAFLDSLIWLVENTRTTVKEILAAVPKPKPNH